MKKTLKWTGLLLTALVVLAVVFADPAESHYVRGCKHKVCMVHVIKPYVGSFLEPVGACESGGGYDLAKGLRAISPGGRYRGRYQFDIPSWYGAGGHGDPINASWYEQAYRAVVWLHVNGRQSWPNC